MISCFLKAKVEQGEHPVHSGRGKNDEMQTTSAALSLCGEMMHLQRLQLSTLLCFLSQQPCPSMSLRKKNPTYFLILKKKSFETTDPRQTCQYQSLYIKDGCRENHSLHPVICTTHCSLLVMFHYEAQRCTYGCKVYKVI